MAELLRLSLPKSLGCAAALFMLCSVPYARAQSEPPPQGVSRGENFSAKPPAQLFASDCTGSGCHKSPQGLGRTQGFSSLAGFLREHYTNSRESAAALANYLSKLPSGPEPREARTPRPGSKPAAAATASGGPAWLEGETKPSPQEGRAPRQTGRASPAAAKPDEEPANAVRQPPAAEPAEAAAKPEAPPKPSARERRGRQPATAAVVPLHQPPEPEAAPAPAPAPPPSPASAPKQYDIFD